MRGLSAYTQTGGRETDDLIAQSAPLVKRIAYHMSGRLPAFVEVDDLIQAGMLGLMEAARRFDATRGASFNTFAEQRIRGAMLDEVRRNDWAPRSVHRKARDISEAIRILETATGEEAKDEAIAAQLGWSLVEYHKTLADLRGQKMLSLDDPGAEGESLGDQLIDPQEEPSETVQKQHLIGHLSQAIEGLPERERLVLSLYYDEELNLKEIGEVLGVSESRISKLHSQALLRLRSWAN
jgi:RNA polymerase sigma factor for flagellar operon FliA